MFSDSIREKNREAVIPPVMTQTVTYLKEKGEASSQNSELRVT